jgi:hypothetical protein
MEEKKAQESSIVTKDYDTVKTGESRMPTYGVIIILIIAFFVLKKFIYIKDDKRDGK